MISIEFPSLPLVSIPRQNLGEPCERLSTFTEVTFKQNTNFKRGWWGIRERLNQRFAKLCMQNLPIFIVDIQVYKYTIMDPMGVGCLIHPRFHLQNVPIGTVAISWFLEGSPNSRLRASRITSYQKSDPPNIH